MRVSLNQIPAEGLVLKEELSSKALDLDTEIIKFIGPIKVKAELSRGHNVITARISLDAVARLLCGRCVSEFEDNFKKEINLNYPVDKSELVIDLDPDIREEIILDYPVKPLCKENCLGLCLKCGVNLNETKCNC